MRKHPPTRLIILLLVYALATLVHFIHNAEFLADYPNMPAAWTREGVYLAWLGMTTVGILGTFLVIRGHQMAGLLFLAVYALLGLDSLGHYVLAPLAAHSLAMHATILLEVTTAALLLIQAVKLITARALLKEPGGQKT